MLQHTSLVDCAWVFLFVKYVNNMMWDSGGEGSRKLVASSLEFQVHKVSKVPPQHPPTFSEICFIIKSVSAYKTVQEGGVS